MLQSEIDALNQMQSICHAASAAIHANLLGCGELDLEALRDKLQFMNGVLSRFLSNYATYEDLDWTPLSDDKVRLDRAIMSEIEQRGEQTEENLLNSGILEDMDIRAGALKASLMRLCISRRLYVNNKEKPQLCLDKSNWHWTEYDEPCQ